MHNRTKRQRKSNTRKLFAGFAALVLTTYTAATLLWPLQSIQATIQTPESIAATDIAIQLPEGTHSSVGAMSYGIFEATDQSTSIPMASITKLVTVLTVLDAKPLQPRTKGPNITFTEQDVAIYNEYIAKDGVVGPVVPGQTISFYDALQITLVPSANNYADKLALWAFGSIDSYVAEANEFLRKNGFTKTTVADAAGFSPNSVTTATELIQLAELALSNEVIAETVAKDSVTIPEFGTFYSTNLLLQTENVIGVKTGTTDEAGNCLVYAARYNIDGSPVTIIGATLNADDRQQLAEQARSTIDQVQAGFVTTGIASPNEVFITYQAEWGDIATVQPVTAIEKPLWKEYKGSYTVTADDYKVGTNPNFSAQFKSGAQTVEIPLALASEISPPSWLWKLTHPHRIFF